MEILMTVAGNVAQQVVDFTLAPTARQVGYLIFYKGNFKDLEDQVKKLNRVKESIEHEVEAERRNGREIEDIVQNWLNRVDEITEAAKQLKDDPRRNNAGCSMWSCPDLRSRHQLSRKAKKMATNVVEVMQEKDKFDGVGYKPPLDGVGSTSATRSSEKLESRNLMKQEIVLTLRDPKISRIGVYGLGGVGKTTLIKEVAKQVKDNKLFDEVVIANISEDPDLGRIQCEIADFLGLHFEEMSIAGRGRRLRQRIKQERSILIILDNVQETLDLEKLGIPLENDHEGCKLLLTSRNQDILEKMEIHKDFGLNVLNSEETWSLFEEMVGDALKDASLHRVAVQMAEKCAGLTVLIVTVAKALKNKKDIKSWEDALKQLKTVDKHGMTEKIYSAMEFSYNHLEDDEVKALFLLCGVIFDPDVDYLLKYGMGLGIMKNINTVNDARLRLQELLGSLQASFLLLEVNRKGKVKMHDTVREVAVSIASRDQHVFKIGRDTELKKWPPENFPQGCRQIILQWCHIHKLPERLECPNVEFFNLSNVNRSLEIPDSFFEGMRNLKVLDLTCMHLSSLPKSFYSLIDLQTLCLDHCALGDMTNVGALKNLQTLSLNGSSIIRLPNELGQLPLLRMLDLTNAGIEIFPSNVISKLTNLEELYVGNTSIKWEPENSVAENKRATLSELRHLTKLTALEIQIQGALVLPRDIMFENLERYKILIGDVWEWSNDYGASKMLKLKLHTSIHLEHGIKELIKVVEDLYLDEINGISNVLFHLNGEGFPLLKHLHIQNNVQIQHMIDSRESNQTDDAFFPNLETLVLQNLSKLEKLCHGGPVTMNSFANLRSIKVKGCDQLEYLFSISMVKDLSRLLEVEISECSSMKKIVFVESSFQNSLTIDNVEFHLLRSLTLRHLPAIDDFYSHELTSCITTKQSLLGSNVPTSFFNAKVKFLNLETLTLSSINLKKIWDDDHLSIADSFHNLANLSVEDCSGLKYLFSSSMIGSLLKLKQLEISKCDMMEEIIATEGRNGDAVEEVQLSKLETVIINKMKSIKKVWHSEFDGLKTLEVSNCETLENIFPSAMHKTFGSLETLKVSNCGAMEEIFKLTVKEVQSEEDTVVQVTQLKKLYLLNLPRLKQIWSQDPRGNIRFHNLQDVHVEDCENIEYLFPFSIAVDLHQLEKLKVDSCGMNEIVARKEGPMEENVIFQFHQLHSLVIWTMHKLMRFYAGNHSLTCPSLRELWVFDCSKLKLLRSQSTSNQRKSADAQTQVSQQQPLLIIEEVIPNLEKWTLNGEEAIMILQDPQWKNYYLRKLKVLRLSNFEDNVAATFLDSIMQKASNLKYLVVQHSSLKEIFHDQRVAYTEDQIELSTQLKNLELYYNGQLQHICREGCQIFPILKVLEELYVTDCASLKILVPSSVTFSHLTYLEIEKCNGLKNLIYSSTARSLGKLESMTLKECNSLEEIVRHEVPETKDEIVFNSLKTLELECLPRLKSFSSSACLFKFPLLKKVVLRGCPRMKIFCAGETSTPMLRKVRTEGKDQDWCWEGDLNGTIKKIFVDKVAFCSLKHLELSQYPELREMWYSPVQQQMFGNVKSLVVQKCDFLSDFLLPLNLLLSLFNLEELEVSECDSLEAIFNLTNMNQKQMLAKETIHLKTITLSSLPELKHVWKQHSQEIVSFDKLGETSSDNCQEETNMQHLHQPASSIEQKHIWTEDPQANLCFHNLQLVCVEDCANLEYLLPFSIATHALQLEKITIMQAGRMKQIVSDNEATMDSPVKFEFNRLTSLVLWNLHELEGFFARKHSIQCPLLRELDVYNCAKLKLFKMQDLSSQGSVSDNDLQISMQQPLFTLEEVFCNLEKLTLNNENASIISHGQFSGEQLCKLKCLYLIEFEDDQATFPYWFLQNLTYLEELFIEMSSFKEIFQEERSINEKQVEIKTRVKRLTLNELNELQHICKEELQIDPVLEILEYLKVDQCSNLKHLVPSSVNFSHLTDLEVQNCSGLTRLITSKTSRSLVKLTTMKIRDCSSLEHVVAKEREEPEDEIAFNSLEILELERLPMIKRFCSTNCFLNFPLLENVVVKQCPRMKIFSVEDTSTPKLEKIVSEEDEKLYWEGDINRTINKMFVDKVAFRNFKHLELSQYPELRELWYSLVQQHVFGNLKSLVVQKCDFLSDVLLPLNLLQALSNLEELQVSECGSLEAVFDLMNMNEKEMLVKETIHLKTITLSCLHELKHIWKRHSQEVVSFDNLGEISSENTKGLKISKIQGFSETKEEDEGDIEHQQPASSIEQVLFPNLETLILKGMPELKTIWHPFFTSNSISSLKTMEVSDCEKLENIFPSYMQSAFTSMKELMVSDCNSIQVIFDFSSEMGSTEDTTSLQTLTLLHLSKLKKIWSRDPQANISFHNLKHVCVEDCENLEYLLPFSIAMHAIQLEDVAIKDAGRLTQIVSDKEGPVDSPVKFEFNHLTSLVLSNLHELEGFSAGNLRLSCPSLRELDVYNCAKLKLFKTRYSNSQRTVCDNKLQKSVQQPLFTLEEVLGNLETLVLNSEDANMILQGQFSGEQLSNLKILYLTKFEDKQAIFPHWFLQNITSLEHLIVEWSSFKEIFQNKMPTHEKGNFETRTRLKKLTLGDLYQLQYICEEGFQIDPILEILEYLKVNQCFNLKHLVPSSVTFSHLTYLKVQSCKGLTHLITSTTARSLVKLTTMKIRDCSSLEHVVAKMREEPEDEIAFNSLEILELERLPIIKRFCSTNCFLNFPLLENVVVKQCPRMKIFSVGDTSTPKLEKIVSEEDEKLYWEGDINRTMNTMFVDMVAFRNFEHLELSQYPEIRELWYSHVQPHVFGNLKSLVVQKCDFLSDVLLPLNMLQALSNLEELQASECDSLEAVFDLTNINDNEMLAKVTVHLKTLTLSSLPELKHIWKQNSQEMVSFDDLGEISCDNYQGLQISKIHGFKETTNKEDEGDIQHQQPVSLMEQLYLPKLETVIIKDMENLKTLWHPILTPNSMGSFETLKVKNCEKIEIIFPEYMHGAFANLETLMVKDCNSVQVIFRLGVNDIRSAEYTTQLNNITLLRLPQLKQIWSRDPQSYLHFHKLQVVHVEDCGNLEYLFPFSIAMDLLQVEEIIIKDAEKMKGIVLMKEGTIDSPVKFDFNHLTSLVLWDLQELEGFYAGNYNLACSSLKELDIRTCAKLKLFKTQGQISQGRVTDNKLQVSMHQPLFTLEEVIYSLESLALNSENASMILQQEQFSGKQFCNLKYLYLTAFEDEEATIPCWFLQNITSLEELLVEKSSFKEIFQEDRFMDENGQIEVRTRIKKLTLYKLHQLQHICKEGIQIDPVLRVLEYLDVDECSNLEHLVPSSLTLSHLTYLEVQNCNGLIDLITPSTARSLVKLTTLKIRECNSVEQVVAEQGEESNDEIAFSSLETLKLESLPRLKMFCSCNCSLELPLLEEVVISNCPRMKIFSLKDTNTPTLQKVLTLEEDEEGHWQSDLNRTVNKIFEDLIIGEEDEGDSEESSSEGSEISRAPSLEGQVGESMDDQIVDGGKQDIQELQSSSDDRDEGDSEESSNEVSENCRAPSLEEVVGESKEDQIVDTRKQEILELLSSSDDKEQKENATSPNPQDALRPPAFQDTEMNESIKEPSIQTPQKAESPAAEQDIEESNYSEISPSGNFFNCTTTSAMADNTISLPTIQDEAIGTQGIYENNERPLVEAAQNALNPAIAQDTVLHEPETHPCENLLNKITSSVITDMRGTTGTQGMDNNNERPMVEATQNVLNPAIPQDTEESHDSKTRSGMNLFNQNMTFEIGDKKETRDVYENIDGPLIQIDQNIVSLATIQSRVIGTHQEMYEDTGRPLIQATQSILSPREIQDIEELHDSNVGTQEMCEIIKRPSVQAAQNELSHIMVHEAAAIDPSSSQAPEPLTSSVPASDAYSNLKGIIDISVQNLSYLEAGVKRHPQVLDWFNTQRQGVFSSLFSEVTCILRTTRRGDLTDDDRSHIRKCCTALEAIGFDDSWLNYVYGSIEECGNGEDLKRKLEEAEGAASTLKAQLEEAKGRASTLKAELQEVESKASILEKELVPVEASLVLLRDEASRVDYFIES